MSIVRRLRHSYERAPGTLRGMLLIGISAFGFSLMHVMIRLLTGNLHPFEVAFFRNLFGFMALLPILARRGPAVLRTERLPLHALRSVLGLVSMLLFFTALQRTGLPKVTAMSFTAPLFATAGAVLFLRERIHARRMAALLIGFAGTVVVMRPDERRRRRRRHGAGLVGAVGGGAPHHQGAVAHRVELPGDVLHRHVHGAALVRSGRVRVELADGREYLWLALMGTVGTISQLIMTQAFREADATAVLPVDFTRLLWASLFGMLVFHESPELATLLGER